MKDIMKRSCPVECLLTEAIQRIPVKFGTAHLYKNLVSEFYFCSYMSSETLALPKAQTKLRYVSQTHFLEYCFASLANLTLPEWKLSLKKI